jgi:RimJ/RimL family protein N-acetyltransferase
MTQPDKRRYAIDLTASLGPRPSTNGDLRPLTTDDRDSLAQLMLDAYAGTIDYEGESIIEAREAVDEWFSDAPLIGQSFGAEIDGRLVSAVLAMMLDDAPFIAIVMTAPEHKGHGLGRAVVAASLESLRAEHHGTVTLYITEGNAPSERLFASLGAVEVADPR